MKQTGKITGLYIYPVKSCRGIELTEMSIDSRGPLHDRQWMIVDENNQFITLRTQSKLAEIKTSIQGSFLHLYAGNNKILVNFDEDCEQTEDVTVWGDVVKAGIENKSINEALSDFLNKTVKLVRYQKQSFRDLENYATQTVKETMFADAMPILLVNENSLLELNKLLVAKGEAPSQIQRFRANIIVENFSAFSEDQIEQFQVGNIVLKNNKPCVRCPVITQDVETGKVVSKQTLTTLAHFRKSSGFDKNSFGVNLTPEGLGKIKVGDLITGL